MYRRTTDDGGCARETTDGRTTRLGDADREGDGDRDGGERAMVGGDASRLSWGDDERAVDGRARGGRGKTTRRSAIVGASRAVDASSTSRDGVREGGGVDDGIVLVHESRAGGVSLGLARSWGEGEVRRLAARLGHHGVVHAKDWHGHRRTASE